MKVECSVNQIAALFEVNLATLTCWGYYLIIDIGISVTSTQVGANRGQDDYLLPF